MLPGVLTRVYESAAASKAGLLQPLEGGSGRLSSASPCWLEMLTWKRTNANERLGSNHDRRPDKRRLTTSRYETRILPKLRSHARTYLAW